MSGVDINFDYAKLEEMAANLDKGAKQLEQTKQQIQRAAHGFNQGSLRTGRASTGRWPGKSTESCT
jgi:hypothetical protein